MTNEDQLLEIARRRRIGVFFDARARHAGLPWIILKKRGLTLAEFWDTDDAMAWLPAKKDTGQNGKIGTAAKVAHGQDLVGARLERP